MKIVPLFKIYSGAGVCTAAVQLQRSRGTMRFSNFLNKALMGKPIMHSARALFLTFLALEKSKRNNTFNENFAKAAHPENYYSL